MSTTEEYYQAYQPADINLLNKMQGKLFIPWDLETTGFNGDRGDQITQIAAMLIDVSSSGISVYKKPFHREIRLNEEKLQLLIQEAESPEDPGYQSLHWVLALNHHHRHTRPEAEYLEQMLAEGYISQSGYDFRMEGTHRVHDAGFDRKGKPKLQKYEQPHKLTLAEIQELVEEEHANKVEEAVALEDFQSWMEEQGTYRTLGHNAHSFDKTFYNHRREALGLSPKKMVVTDTMWVSRLLFIPAVLTMCDHGDEASKEIREALDTFKNGYKFSSKLQDLRAALKVSGGEAHRALGDVESTIEILKAMISYFSTHYEALTNDASPVKELFEFNKAAAFHNFQENNFRY
jgi:DNA polymerase III alpha subunit (gram-positive type)